jgi:hypothetical protein
VSVWMIFITMTFVLPNGEEALLNSRWNVKQFASEEVCKQHFEPAIKAFEEELNSGRMRDILKQHGISKDDPSIEKVEIRCVELQKGQPV